ncbi:alpha/beta fold hydrolase [Segniliparus rugosus]|uniref:alpha/beta fold hydrolase n=1 Tax=Segniliparus rugosus TaxID=286804 RepID=UPI00058C6A81|nr:alpha/beta fold hydrolase [Segniliparus rugosus]
MARDRSLFPALAGVAAAVAGAALLWPAKRALPNADLEPPQDAPRESWATSSDGARLRVLTYGPADAPPLVLAHGWTCAAQAWLPQVRTLVGDFRVVAFDQRGHGQSDAGAGRFSVDLLADDLDAVLAHVLRDGERAVLAGHSMGGMSIIAWADRHPGRVGERAKAAVLVGTSAHCRPRAFNEAVAAVLGLPFPMGLIRNSWATRRAVRNYALSPSARAADVDFTARMALDCPPRTRGEWQLALVPLDIRSGVERLTVPTTVVAGAQDRVLPLGHSRRIAEALAEHGWLERFVVLPDTGHMIGLEASGSLNAIIRGTAEAAERRAAPTPR